MKSLEMEIDELLRDAPVQQSVAVSAFHLRFADDEEFQFERVKVLSNGLICVFAQFHKENAAFLPVFHDFPIESEVLPEFIDSAPDRRRYLAMAAPDSAVVLYSVADATI